MAVMNSPARSAPLGFSTMPASKPVCSLGSMMSPIRSMVPTISGIVGSAFTRNFHLIGRGMVCRIARSSS